MNIYSHPHQMLHAPHSYLSRGKMRAPQEKPERLTALLAAVHTLQKSMNLEVITPQDRGIDPILAVHDFDYVHFLKTAYQAWHALDEDWGEEVMSNIYIRDNPRVGILAQAAHYLADGSCPIGKHTWTSAYFAAQTALGAATELLAGGQCAVGLTRPAGHHARKDAAGGFCYLNNGAIAASFLKQKFKKIAIIDTDMHHGQGIQDIFYDRSDILYVSVHGDPTNFYPVVAGFANERGVGAGAGFNVNFPMPHGIDEAGFFAYVDAAIDVVNTFDPDAIIHIVGFDVHRDDPQSKSQVSTAGFHLLGQKIAALQAPKMILVEGGV